MYVFQYYVQTYASIRSFIKYVTTALRVFRRDKS